MRKLSIRYIPALAICIAGLQISAAAQDTIPKFYSFKNFGGAISTTHQYYFANDKASIALPEKRYASNNYINLNYTYSHIIAGVQAEGYLPALQGYKFTPDNKTKVALTHYFAGYKSNKLDVTVGTFYDQFGNGLIFRSFEDRQLGIDNIIRGAHVRIAPVKGLEIKAFYGKQRNYFEYKPGTIGGADAEITVFNKEKDGKNISLKIGGSFLNIHQDSVLSIDLPHKTNTNAWAARTSFVAGNYQLDAEYMQHTPEAYYPSYFFQKGSALLINQNYTTKGGLGINLGFRRLELAALKADYSVDDIGNYVNYLPSLTKQHTWLVSSVYPATTDWKNEIGGQANISYLFKKNTALGGKYGTKLFVNGSLYRELFFDNYTIDNSFKAKFIDFGGYKQYSDINVTIEKKFSKKVKGTLALISQYQLKNGSTEVKTKTVATDFLFKLDDQNSIRTELQHMWNDVEELNWAAAVVEYTHKGLSLFVTDLTNYQSQKIQYYTIGGSYSKDAHRLMLSFGKQRAGLLCVGGICRNVPSSMGFTASYNYNF